MTDKQTLTDRITRKACDVKSLDVGEFLPQKPSFVLVGRLIDYDEETTSVRTSLKVTDDTAFVENGRFQCAGIAEHIAQSCAARKGFMDWLNGEPVKTGVVGEVKQMKVYYLPRVGDELFTDITPRSEFMGVLLAAAKVRDSVMNLIAECLIKVVV